MRTLRIELTDEEYFKALWIKAKLKSRTWKNLFLKLLEGAELET